MNPPSLWRSRLRLQPLKEHAKHSKHLRFLALNAASPVTQLIPPNTHQIKLDSLKMHKGKA